MEEDIKILKEMLNDLKERHLPEDVYILKEERTALENILKENEHLNNSIRILLKTCQMIQGNSIPKSVIREKINKRQSELVQELKTFKDDIRLNTLQEIYYGGSNE